MQTPDKIKDFAALVCEQIRWKKARGQVLQEMENHILDQKDAYLAKGLDEEAAMNRAIADTGDAVAIGAELDRVHRPKPQWGMLALTAALVVLGFILQLVFVPSKTTAGNAPQFLAAGIGIAFLFLAYFSDFTLIGKYPKTLYFFVLALLLALVIASPGQYGWVTFWQISVNAGYFSLLLPLCFAGVIYRMRDKGYLGIILCGAAFLLPAGILLVNRYLSALMLLGVCGLLLLTYAILRNWFRVDRRQGLLLVWVPTAASIVGLSVYGWHRIMNLLNPSLDLTDNSWWMVSVKALLKGAKLLGTGEIPEGWENTVDSFARSGYMLTYIAYKFGLLAAIALVGLFACFIVKSFQLCLKQKSSLGLLVSLAVLLTFTCQVVGYVAANLGFELASPLILPLLSGEGISLPINLGLIGFMLSTFRSGDAVYDAQPVLSCKNFIT